MSEDTKEQIIECFFLTISIAAGVYLANILEALTVLAMRALKL